MGYISLFLSVALYYYLRLRFALPCLKQFLFNVCCDTNIQGRSQPRFISKLHNITFILMKQMYCVQTFLVLFWL